jgi:hypothetical protein
MAKKTQPEPEAAPSEAIVEAEESAPAPEPADPTLLGVQVPLTVTFAAVRQVADAWRRCFTELRAAARAKLLKETTTDEAPPAAAPT